MRPTSGKQQHCSWSSESGTIPALRPQISDSSCFNDESMTHLGRLSLSSSRFVHEKSNFTPACYERRQYNYRCFCGAAKRGRRAGVFVSLTPADDSTLGRYRWPTFVPVNLLPPRSHCSLLFVSLAKAGRCSSSLKLKRKFSQALQIGFPHCSGVRVMKR